eukprot:scaffold8095_cov82-Skeletonema_dohrnii-CCMP3373.AAC.8
MERRLDSLTILSELESRSTMIMMTTPHLHLDERRNAVKLACLLPEGLRCLLMHAAVEYGLVTYAY